MARTIEVLNVRPIFHLGRVENVEMQERKVVHQTPSTHRQQSPERHRRQAHERQYIIDMRHTVSFSARRPAGRRKALKALSGGILRVAVIKVMVYYQPPMKLQRC